jgi:hypothetical protein
MPKADLVLSDGTRVTIQGTSEQVASLVQQITGHSKAETRGDARGAPRRAHHGKAATTKGPVDHIRDLIADGFFASKQGLGDVRKKLEEGAHIYPITTLAPALYRLVRAKELRRLKEGGTWKYVNP